MGNNASSSPGGNDSSTSPSSPSTCRPNVMVSTHRTHSLPLGHHPNYRSNRHHHHQNFHHTHSDRRCMTNQGVQSPPHTRRSTSKLRQAWPNFVSNVSAAIGHKLPWTNSGGGGTAATGNSAGKRKFQKSATAGMAVREKRSRSKTREHCRLFRELVSNWRLSDLHCLVVEFEAALALRELKRRADSARIMAGGVKDDFARLFQQMFPSGGIGDQHQQADDSSADAFLVLDNRSFPIHRAFLSRRCSFFRRLFRGFNGTEESGRSWWRPTIPVTFPAWMTPLNGETMALLLEYLYTGEVAADGQDDKVRALIRFNEEQNRVVGDGEQGKWTSVEEDVATMLDVHDADAILLFTSAKQASADESMGAQEEEAMELSDDTPGTADEDPRSKRAPVMLVDKQKPRCCQFKCHSVVLAARSPFFRAIIRKRRHQDEQKQQQEQNETFLSQRSASSPFSPWKRPRSPQSPGSLLEIVLDESVIPRQYAPVLLHAMYTDQVDLSLVMRDCVASAASCLTEVQAIAAGKCQLSPVDEATEIYQIARFLEFEKLAQGCEDVIVSYITLDTLPSIYAWSSESYGSAYVRRQCINYLCHEFDRFCASPLLFDAEETLLVEVLKSDYVQASELEILNAIIRWGEHQLVKRIEEREPNILVGTTHSISRKGVKRADLSDEELKEILVNLLPLIRIDYVLPQNHAVLENAISRGLINVPSVDLLSDSESGGGVLLPPVVAARRRQRKRHSHHHHAHSPSALIRSCSSSGSPNMDNVHLEHSTKDHWSKPHRRSAGPRLFLPYLEESRTLLEKRVAESPDQLSALINHHPPVESVSDRLFVQQSTNRYPDTLYMVDGMAQNNCSFEEGEASEIAVPPSSTLMAVQDRVDRILRTSTTVKRALACGCSYHRSGVLKQVRLRALREYGLLDNTLAVLDTYGQLASPSSIDYGPPSFCSSVPLSPADTTDGLQFMDGDAGNEQSGHYLAASPTKRRFRSQPELSQCDLTGCSSTCMDWPDLMASSLATATSMDGLSPTRHPTSIEWPSAAAVSASTSSLKYDQADHDPSPDHNLRQQFVDLTKQICDLVVVDGENTRREDSASDV